MSWSELERLVDAAESQRDLQRSLRHWRSRKELQRAGLEEQAEVGSQQQAGV